MELRQLEVFLAVAEEQHFTRAAARCNLSQSALSASVRALEHELDARLFARTTRRVTLTEAGEALALEARRTLAAAQSARDAVEATKGVVSGRVDVGGIRTVGKFDQAALIARYRREHPNVAIHYTMGSSKPLVEEVSRGNLDLAFVALPHRLPRGLHARELFVEPIAYVCLPDDPLADREGVSLTELADRRFIAAPSWSAAQAALDRVGARPDRTLRIEVNDVTTMLDFVANGLGVALLARSVVPESLPLRAIPVTEPDAIWRFGIVTGPEDAMSVAARTFLGLLDP